MEGSKISQDNPNVFGVGGNEEPKASEPEKPAGAPVVNPPVAEVPPGAEVGEEVSAGEPRYMMSLATAEEIQLTGGSGAPRVARLNKGKFIVRVAIHDPKVVVDDKPEMIGVATVRFPVSAGKLGRARWGFDESQAQFFAGSADCVSRLKKACQNPQELAFVTEMLKRAGIREEAGQSQDLNIFAGRMGYELRAFCNKYRGYFQAEHDKLAAKAQS